LVIVTSIFNTKDFKTEEIQKHVKILSTKEVKDAEKGKDAVDMGMRAKAIKSMLKSH